MITSTTNELKQRWDDLLTEEPRLRIRNAAERLGVSEAELLSTRIGDGVTPLRPEFRAILKEAGKLGHVMALTRNGSAVHERKGVYLNPSLEGGPVGLFVGDDIDLRIFWAPWASAFAVTEPAAEAPRLSLQFFASDGEAVHKIYLTSSSDAGAYADLVQAFRDASAPQELTVKPWPAEPAEKPDHEVDAVGFRQGWKDLKDTHDFYGLVRRFGLSRTQALRLAPEGGYAVRVKDNALRTLLTGAAARSIPVMVFVGNKGMIQIHTGEVKNLMDVPEWFNVIDPDFNLHVKEADIVQSWIVRKPTVDGMVTALECFDARGTQVVQVFGKRKPGIPEREEWRTLVAELEAGSLSA